ncbi:MAG: hypothetical protein ACHRHE_09990 [Tepidisphaerales bacterium]
MLRAIDVHNGIYLARLDVHTTVTPEGRVRRVFTQGVSYGPNDRPGSPQVEIREGQLSAAQMAELAQLFAGWESLSDQYDGVPDGPEVVFRYGDKQIRGGMLPRQVWTAYKRIEQLAELMPRVGPTTQDTHNDGAKR